MAGEETWPILALTNQICWMLWDVAKNYNSMFHDKDQN